MAFHGIAGGGLFSTAQQHFRSNCGALQVPDKEEQPFVVPIQTPSSTQLACYGCMRQKSIVVPLLSVAKLMTFPYSIKNKKRRFMQCSYNINTFKFRFATSIAFHTTVASYELGRACLPGLPIDSCKRDLLTWCQQAS